MAKLSQKEYWDSTYGEQHGSIIDPVGYRNYCIRKTVESICEVDLDGKNVLEIGAGGSAWLQYLAKLYPTARFSGLDYSEIGCEKLREASVKSGLNIQVIHGDLFEPPGECLNQYDVVLSFGVVEHFDELDDVLSAFKRFLKPGGHLYTIIPNMSGVIGKMTKKLNKSVYDIHNPHNLESFLAGHAGANLKIVSSGYVCSNDFSVLSSCIDMTNLSREYRFKRSSYLWLTRLSKFIWLFESKFFELPKGDRFSPYIYCIAQHSS